MGNWGPGNFDSDAALEMAEVVLKVATSEIEAFCASARVSVEDLDDIMAGVAIHLTLHEHCNASAPNLALVRKLRKKVLRLYDKGIDSLEPAADYKRRRRAPIVKTLDRYERAAGMGSGLLG